MSAAQDAGRGRNRWPEHLGLFTEPIEQRRRVTGPTPQARVAAAPPSAPSRQPQRPAQQRPVPQRPTQQFPPHQQQARPQQVRQGQRHPAPGRLTGPQLRRRWIGGIAAAVLVGATLPVQIGAVAIESLELLSPGPDGSAMTVVLAAIATQLVLLVIPMLVGPAIGGFARRWRARLIVLSANAVLVCGIALIGWIRISQA